MDDNCFKRLTFRFQGGKGGLPKATTGEEAVAASLTVTVALGTAKKRSQETNKAKRQRQAKEKKEKQAEADAEAEDDTHDGEGEGSEVPNTPEAELPTATRTVMTIHRPARSSQVVTRAQRRGTVPSQSSDSDRQGHRNDVTHQRHPNRGRCHGIPWLWWLLA